MQYSIFLDLIYHKTCLENFNASICQNLTNYNQELDFVQRESSHWILKSTVALAVPSIVMSQLLGSFSDLVDRKWPLILPPIGMVVACVVYILLAVYDSVPVSLIVVASFVSGICGGFVSVIMGVMSYISAVSDEKSRTMRVALVESMTFLGGTIGPFLGGVIYNKTQSHAAVFYAILACYVATIFYVYFAVSSVRPSSHNNYRQLLTCNQVWTKITMIFKSRPNHQRRNIFLLILCALFIMV